MYNNVQEKLVPTDGNGPRISDGVDQQAVKATRAFPYLVAPEANPPGKIELSIR